MSNTPHRPWRILVVDDEDDMHVVTRSVIRRVHFEGRSVEMLSAHSAKKAREILADNHNVALILLDVVMETPTAGLDLVKWIRSDLGNQAVRIVLRTGHPGEVPEAKVIAEYDINDYKEKGELDIGRLRTCLIASFRAYRQIRELEQIRIHLKSLIESSDIFTKLQGLETFAQSVLGQISAMIDPEGGLNAVVFIKKAKDQMAPQALEIFSTLGSISKNNITSVNDLDKPSRELIEKSAENQDNYYEVGQAALYFTGQEGEIIAYIEYEGDLDEANKALLTLFTSRMARNLLRAQHCDDAAP